MLVLTRKIGEAISIGDEIKVIVMQIKGKQVRLGIKASPNTVVHREEIFQRIHEENKAASMTDPADLNKLNVDTGGLRAEGKSGTFVIKKPKKQS